VVFGGSVEMVTDPSGSGVVDVLPPGVGVGVSVGGEGDTVGSTGVIPVEGPGPGAVVADRPDRGVGGVVAAWLWVTEAPRVGEVAAGEGVGVTLVPGGPAGEGGWSMPRTVAE
jgi:hypothetical protein